MKTTNKISKILSKALMYVALVTLSIGFAVSCGKKNKKGAVAVTPTNTTIRGGCPGCGPHNDTDLLKIALGESTVGTFSNVQLSLGLYGVNLVDSNNLVAYQGPVHGEGVMFVNSIQPGFGDACLVRPGVYTISTDPTTPGTWHADQTVTGLPLISTSGPDVLHLMAEELYMIQKAPALMSCDSVAHGNELNGVIRVLSVNNIPCGATSILLGGPQGFLCN